MDNKKTLKSYAKHTRPHGENVIKADLIINAFEKNRMKSRLYRILKYFGFR